MNSDHTYDKAGWTLAIRRAELAPASPRTTTTRRLSPQRRPWRDRRQA